MIHSPSFYTTAIIILKSKISVVLSFARYRVYKNGPRNYYSATARFHTQWLRKHRLFPIRKILFRREASDNVFEFIPQRVGISTGFVFFRAEGLSGVFKVKVLVGKLEPSKPSPANVPCPCLVATCSLISLALLTRLA